MKKFLLNVLIFFPVVFLCVSCNDSIFYKVSEESPLRDPLIGGSPTNFVVFNSKMYVASGKQIWEYDSNGWRKYTKLEGFVGSLAATTSSLYAVYLKGTGNVGGIVDCTTSTSVTELSDISNVQSIYAVGSVLFACVMDGKDTYKIYYDTGSGFSTSPISDTKGGVLRGVASDSANYYLCTEKGIYSIGKSSLSSSASLVDNSNKIFKGIIQWGTSSIAAISEDGGLYKVESSGVEKKVSIPDSRWATGALAIYKKDSTYLLLVGRREKNNSSTNSGYTNGYVEIDIDDTNGITGSSFKEPGKNSSSSSIENNDRYTSSLGIKIVKHIIQTPSDIDSNMTLFASTQKDGVWSYLDHGDGEGVIWNAE